MSKEKVYLELLLEETENGNEAFTRINNGIRDNLTQEQLDQVIRASSEIANFIAISIAGNLKKEIG